MRRLPPRRPQVLASHSRTDRSTLVTRAVALLVTGAVLLGSAPSGSAASAPGVDSILGPVNTGYRDFHFGNSVISTPTAEKPESKLWFHDGRWWGCLWDPGSGAYRIHRFDEGSHDWTSVGPNADNRTNTLVDVLWDGSRLYIVSHEFDGSGASRQGQLPGHPADLRRCGRGRPEGHGAAVL